MSHFYELMQALRISPVGKSFCYLHNADLEPVRR